MQKLRTESIETVGGIRVVDVDTGELAFTVSTPHRDAKKRRAIAVIAAAGPELLETIEEILECKRTGAIGSDGYQGFERAHLLVQALRGGK